jgi:hypothetical protein
MYNMMDDREIISINKVTKENNETWIYYEDESRTELFKIKLLKDHQNQFHCLIDDKEYYFNIEEYHEDTYMRICDYCNKLNFLYEKSESNIICKFYDCNHVNHSILALSCDNFNSLKPCICKYCTYHFGVHKHNFCENCLIMFLLKEL